MASFFGEPRRLGGGQSGTLPKQPPLEQVQIEDTTGLQQEQMAPGVSALQRQLRELGSQRFGSLSEREAALRAGTRGAGEALGSLQAAAARTAEGVALGRAGFGLQRQQLALQERERQGLAAEREMARQEQAAIRRSTPIGGGGGGIGAASRRLATRAGFEGTSLAGTSPAGANISFGASPQQRAAVEQQALGELQALSGGGIEQQLGGVF